MKILKVILDLLDDPKKVKRLHAFLALAWFVAAFPVMIFLSGSLPFVVFISVYAIVAAHWSAWDAAGGEMEIEKIKKKLGIKS